MRFDLVGYNIDNLLKVLYVKKVALFNVQKIGRNQVSFEIMDKDIKKVRRHVVNFKVKETLSKFKTFPKYLLSQIGVIIGCFIGLIFGFFASNYTWQIMIYGTEELSVNEIISVLSENNIKKGKINKQSSEEIEEILLNRYDRIAQVSVIRKGTAIIINLSEKLVYDKVEYEPITARYNGIIKHINLITGTLNVKVGDYVNVGEVLVLPFNINSNGEKVNVCPLAEIKAEIFAVTKLEMNKFEQVLVRTGKSSVTYNYKFNNINLFSGKSKNSFALFETNVYNENISDLIPLNREVCVYYELKTIEIEHDFEAEEQTLIEKCEKEAYKTLPIGEVLSEKLETKIMGNSMYAISTIMIYGLIN